MAIPKNVVFILAGLLVATTSTAQKVTGAGTPEAIPPMTTIGSIGYSAPSPISTNVDGAVDAASDVLAAPATSDALLGLRPERPNTLRGTKEAQLYRRASPSVVLVITKDGLGSGSLLTAGGDILTNWHVVRGYGEVGVIFKPPIEGKTPTRKDLRRGRVVKVDEVADLALVHVDDVPSGIEPLLLGDMAQISVGDDVHAIGHPTGEAWTYTRGVISQIRQDYQWSSQETKKAHHADVIQTQTPINPGNSGGPLLSDQGTLIGVNSFKSQGEGLNFAVAVDEVQRFIAASSGRVAADIPVRRASAATTSCQPKEIYSGRNKAGTAYIIGYDLDCDGKADMEIRVPDDKKEPITAVFDRKKTGKIDLIVFDVDRDTKWDVSLHDTKSQGHWDLIGLHPEGSLVASRFIPYSKEAFARVLVDPATYKH